MTFGNRKIEYFSGSVSPISEKWDCIITPRRNWFDIDLKGLWQYRYLGYMYVKRNFITQYRQTILGPLWFFIQPIFTIIVYMFIFGGLAGISTEGVPQPLFYMAGILFWNYFSDCFMSSSNVFVTNAQIFGKVYFPRLIVPISGLFSALFKFAVQAVLFVIIYVWCLSVNSDISVNLSLLLLPLLILMLALHAFSWGLLVSSATYKYRDLQIMISFVMQLFMYATPVVYPLETIPEKYKVLVSLNPLSAIFETFRYGAFNVGMLDWGGLLYSFIFLLVVLSASILLFNRVERNFMDTV